MIPRTGTARQAFSTRDQQQVRKPLARVCPRLLDLEASFAGERQQIGLAVLVGILGMDRLAPLEAHLHLQYLDVRRLPRAADEMHLDSARALIEKGAMLKAGQIKMAPELAIDSREHVQVERCGDSQRVVVRGLDDALRLLQIGAEEEGIAGCERAPHFAQHRCTTLRIEVANARAEK